MDKKSGEMSMSEAENPISESHKEGALKEVCNSSIDSVLANEMLVSIFEFLPAADRMRVELVSKKWNRLANRWGWIKYTIVSVKQFSGWYKWENACSRTSENFEGITSILNKCKKLEILQIDDGDIPYEVVYYFVVLPPALKCVYIGDFSDYRSFFLQVVEQDIQLESLDLSAWFKFDIFPLDVINFGRLKYLALTLNWGLLNNFSRLIENLSHLEALDLTTFDDAEVTWTDLLFEVIANKCTSLKHLGLNADLPNLCSVYVQSDEDAIPIFALFEKLSLSGRLQYFYTSEQLKTEDVCQALVRCKSLTGIFFRLVGEQEEYRQQCIDTFLATLEFIHRGEQPPAADNDKRILHTNFGNRSEENLPHHPWAKFYEKFWQFPPSGVREYIWLEGVSNKPNSRSSLQLF